MNLIELRDGEIVSSLLLFVFTSEVVDKDVFGCICNIVQLPYCWIANVCIEQAVKHEEREMRRHDAQPTDLSVGRVHT